MDRVRQILRSGDWLTRERIRLVAVTLVIASTIGFLYLVVTAHGVIDRQGRPLGTDFSNVYAAGTYVLEGDPEAPFDLSQQYARERAMFGAANAVLRLALSAILSFHCRHARENAVWTRARGLAGDHAWPLSAGDLGDPQFVIPGRAKREPGIA